MTSEATQKRIEEDAFALWYAFHASPYHKEAQIDVIKLEFQKWYNQAIEDVLKEIQWSSISYDEKKRLMEKSRSLKLKSSTHTQKC